MSLWTSNGVVSLRCVASRPRRFTFTSPTALLGQVAIVALGQVTCEYWHGVVTPSHEGFDGGPPAKWSPSSTVTTNSVFERLIPSAWRRAKNRANAEWLSCASDRYA